MHHQLTNFTLPYIYRAEKTVIWVGGSRLVSHEMGVT
jgi:hypothetical protein